MKIQMHNERSNAIGLDRDLELIGGGWGGFKWKKWKKWQKGVEKLNISVCMIMWKSHMTMRNGPEGIFAAKYEMLQEGVTCCYCIFYFAQSCKIVGSRAKWLFYY